MPQSFVSITSDDAWFKNNPNKIAGVEYESNSFIFPIRVKGTKEDVLRVTGMLDVNTELEMAELEAEALILTLKLRKIKTGKQSQN